MSAPPGAQIITRDEGLIPPRTTPLVTRFTTIHMKGQTHGQG